MRLGGIVIAALALLGACTSDPTPREPDPTPTTSSATPARPVPTMPAQASEDSPEGAAAFVNHYVDVFNYAAATGDVAELSRLSSPDCTGCQKYISLYRDTYAAGGYFKGGDWEIGEVEVRFDKAESYATTRVKSDESLFKASRDEPEQAGAGTDTELVFAVSPPEPEHQITQLVLRKGS